MVHCMTNEPRSSGAPRPGDVASQHPLAPGLYALLSDNLLPLERYPAAAATLAAAGVRTLQIRVKAPVGDARLLALQRAVAAALAGWDGLLVCNDRPDLAALLLREAPPGLRVGLHLGQDDLPPRAARAIVGPDVLLGLSTHTPAQVAAAAAEPVDYLGFGPVFATTTKANPDPVVGLSGLAAAARAAARPVVAIGGISAADAPACRAAGAHAVALVGALFAAGEAGLAERARALLEVLA